MAIGHIIFDRNKPHGAELRQALDNMENGFIALQELLATMIQMQDSGSSTSYIVDRFGFTSTAQADAAVAEISSDLGKLTVNTSVTNVNAALTQMFSKFR